MKILGIVGGTVLLGAVIVGAAYTLGPDTDEEEAPTDYVGLPKMKGWLDDPERGWNA
jgi:hypothetical protein